MASKFRRFLSMAVMIGVLMSMMPATVQATELNLNTGVEVRPEYEIKVDGNKGTVTRLNSTNVIYEDMYIRYAVSFSINDEPSMMIDLIDVKWDENQEGIKGTFSIPKIQISGEITNQCFMLTTDENANQIPITDVVANAYGLLTK